MSLLEGINSIEDLSAPEVQEIISRSMKKAEVHYGSLTTDQYKHIRRLAKTRLFFLCYGILKYKKLSKNLHGEVCNWFDLTRNKPFRELLLPRGHYKSTIGTISESIQTVLPYEGDPEPGESYARLLGPDCRILLAHEVHDMAGRFLKAIQDHFITNHLLMGLFPELIPSTKSRLNKYEFELPHSDIRPEPTFDTMGVGARGQGRHFDKIKPDDLIGDKARDSATEMQAAKDWFDNIQSFFVSLKNPSMDISGTRWAKKDLYDHIHEVYGDELIRYIRAVIEYDKHGNQIPIFPEEYPLDRLKIISKNKKIWTAQYLNNPADAQAEFDPLWKRFYTFNSTLTHVVIKAAAPVIPADVNKNGVTVRQYVSTPVDVTYPVSGLDKVLLIDPAMDGPAGYMITGTDERGRVYILKALKKSLRPPDLVDLVFRDVLAYRLRVVAIEAVLFSEVFKDWIEREQQIRRIPFIVEAISTKNRAKIERVRALTNYFSAGMIFMHEGQKDLLEEYDNFGATEDYHMLDALAQGPHVWRPAVRQDRIEELRAAERKFLAAIDPQTGYSAA